MSIDRDRSAWPAVPGYDLHEVIGRGGFSTVYRATQTSVDAARAVKVLSGSLVDAAAERRFRREVHAVGTLSDHPHVVGLIDAGTTAEDMPFIVMQIVDGGSFGAEVRRSGPLSPERVRRVGREVGDALDAAHESGILHRDIKPDNVLVGRRGRAMLTDFGIATLTDSSDSTSGRITGTLAYTAPEIVEGGRPGPASDVFSLGATMYALLAGRGPFEGEADHLAAIMWRIANEEPPPLPPHLPAGLVGLIGDCLTKDPARRPGLAEVQARLGGGDVGRSAGSATPDEGTRSDETVRLEDLHHRPTTPTPGPPPGRAPTPTPLPAPTPAPVRASPVTPDPQPGRTATGLRSTLGRAPAPAPAPTPPRPPSGAGARRTTAATATSAGRPGLRGSLSRDAAPPGPPPPGAPPPVTPARPRRATLPSPTGRPSPVVVAALVVVVALWVIVLGVVLLT